MLVRDERGIVRTAKSRIIVTRKILGRKPAPHCARFAFKPEIIKKTKQNFTSLSERFLQFKNTGLNQRTYNPTLKNELLTLLQQLITDQPLETISFNSERLSKFKLIEIKKGFKILKEAPILRHFTVELKRAK